LSKGGGGGGGGRAEEEEGVNELDAERHRAMPA
jgi:hypothetical protein